jgi:fructose-1,6-bisphosphatase/inositol monophosphatase family enzyme
MEYPLLIGIATMGAAFLAMRALRSQPVQIVVEVKLRAKDFAAASALHDYRRFRTS